IAAAWFLWQEYKKRGMHDTAVFSLTVMIAVIGMGSALFHLFANYITMLADVAPIVFFVIYYLWVAQRTLLNMSSMQAALGLCAFFFFSWLMGKAPDAYSFNGSIAYFPCIMALMVVAALLKKRSHPATRLLVRASALLIVSLTFRSIDMQLCDTLPIGTHFLWHILNGTVLYTLTRAILEQKSTHVN
ncbi:MAG: hypothetical protein AB7L92_03120, partial [Alphaproteobacteria bacterium]